MEDDLLQKLERKAITKEELLRRVEQDPNLLPELLQGVFSPRAAIRYGCAKVLMDLSERSPEKLYPHMGEIIRLLDSSYRILRWNALAIIANLVKVDRDRKFDAIFSKYYSFLGEGYMVTVANIVGNSAKIALARPDLVPNITTELLRVEGIPVTSHLTEECKRVIMEQAIRSFDAFFERVEGKARLLVLSFVRRQLHSGRASLRMEAESFLQKWE